VPAVHKLRVILALALAGWLPAADTAELHLGKGYDALRQDRYETAVTEFREALRLDPSLTMRARFPLAVALFDMKQTADARREFETVRHEAGDHPNVAYYLGRLDLLDQDYSGAIRNLTKAAAKPPFRDTEYYLGLAYFKRGDLPAAEKWLKQAGRADPRDSLVPYQLGQLYRKQGREEEARKALALSADLRRRNTSESELRTECAQKLDTGPREEARALCQRLYDPNSAERLTMLGTLYGQHGDLEAALDPLRRAAELAPQSPQMQYNLAFTYYQMGRFAEARTPLAQALERWPDLFQLNSLYGAVLARLGEDSAAYTALHRAHELNTQDAATADLLFTTIMALARKSQAARQYTDARQYYEEALKLRPGDPQAQKALVELEASAPNGH